MLVGPRRAMDYCAEFKGGKARATFASDILNEVLLGMAQPHQYDIAIGKDQWIRWVDIQGRREFAVDIDWLIAPMQEFWMLLESNCVAGCCGIDAFGLWPEDIQRASKGLADASLRDKFAALRTFVQQSGASTFVSTRLNNFFDRAVLLQLLDHISRHIATEATS
jgi:hypothetical protein